MLPHILVVGLDVPMTLPNGTVGRENELLHEYMQSIHCTYKLLLINEFTLHSLIHEELQNTIHYNIISIGGALQQDKQLYNTVIEYVKALRPNVPIVLPQGSDDIVTSIKEIIGEL